MIKKQLFLLCTSLLFILMMTSCTPEQVTAPTTTEALKVVVPPEPVYTRIFDTKYVEERNTDNKVIRSWNYNTKQEVVEYSEYFYDELNRNNLIKSYSSEATSDATFQGKFVYTFDGSTTNIIKSELIDKSDSTIQSYSATYNSKGKYLTFILTDSENNVLENRVAVYNSTEEYFLTETYYSDVTKDVIVEKITRSYDGTIASRHIQDEVLTITPVDPKDPSSDAMDVKFFESTIIRKYSWSPNPVNKSFYLRQNFTGGGELLEMTQNIFDTNGNIKLQSTLSTGKLQSYITYSYDNDFLTDESYYDKYDTITTQFTTKLYKVKDQNYYEKVTYSYGYVTPAVRSTTASLMLNANRLKAPTPNHLY
ncbi:MAG: hypothetical protein A2015_10940 [Spirochaetes bacterium GWF1_31_7]|nr:MAG: hypothetical protein A2Y30_13075 [Spirochaetes bacterium GWE1_32_154]OHD48373.1 MAG: hypothetical protein A2015_10940 [Spirochaetes bacterium GWF1_31_7]OHD50466.1 MAG: hypothetical protein A2Y29_11120 [Spirochaetes bacterium GWE2_31_10]OHD82665.1 MAG: hypothetical protein A2355_15200 [Spirochaetes bacterium RIFOXYB1_FULL_32_8]HBD93225.1 hypothetical protein [Spirochaetia bacterium]